MKRVIIADKNALSDEDIKKLEAEGFLVIEKVAGREVMVVEPFAVPPQSELS